MKTEYTCTNEECQHTFPVHYYNGTGTWEEECPKCHWEIDTEEIEREFNPPQD